MCETEATLTVYFDDPFWVGVLTRREGHTMTAARIVFGAEPKDYEVYERLLRCYGTLRFGGKVAVDSNAAVRMNPKRMQREASRLMENTGAGTKAQQALAQAREETKRTRLAVSREAREAEEQRKFDLRQAKRREKHRGH